MTKQAKPSKRCCENCHHFQAASQEETWAWLSAPAIQPSVPERAYKMLGWCWWLADHPGMKYEVPEWMLPRALAPDGNGLPRVALAADDGARCAQWRARQGRRDWTGR